MIILTLNILLLLVIAGVLAAILQFLVFLLDLSKKARGDFFRGKIFDTRVLIRNIFKRNL